MCRCQCVCADKKNYVVRDGPDTYGPYTKTEAEGVQRRLSQRFQRPMSIGWLTTIKVFPVIEGGLVAQS